MGEKRVEMDSMGEMEVPAEALYGAQTQRAVLNFPVSGYRFGREFIKALGLVKFAAAEANARIGKLDAKLSAMIQRAAREVIDGQHDSQFVVDIFQTGSGTSSNMNANEVIANRAIQLAGGKVGSKEPIHPNDHVNMGQSSNDVIPTAMHIAAVQGMHRTLMPALHRLHNALKRKAVEFEHVVKIGRTHLMDATPIRMGQVFSGYAAQVSHADRRIMQKIITLRELPIGGTAVGTGINTHPDFARQVCSIINHETHESFHEAPNHFEAQHCKDSMVGASGMLKTVAISLMKIANDVRWMGSGPRCGIGEVKLPPVQPGSSIMPGKVNPVICESLMMACCHVLGNDATIGYAGATLGNFELHVGMPVIAYNFNESVRVLSKAADMFTEKCVDRLEVDEQRCKELIEGSLALCTPLAPKIGYDKAAAIAKEAYSSGKTVREIAKAQNVLPADELDETLDVRRMTEPQSE